MATGVKPRDEDLHMSRSDVEALEDAMKNKKFRELLGDYFEEVRDPANQALYQREMTQLEKERGYDVTFINPKGGYVIKTSVAGDRKAFINICSSDTIAKPECRAKETNGSRGTDWKIPYSLIPPRDDFGKNREKCVIYDVVFHPDTLRMADLNKRFRELVNNTAIDALKKAYKINLDSNNIRFPKSYYKGATVPAVIRKEDPNYKPPSEEETADLTPEMIEKLYPQRTYTENIDISAQAPAKTSKKPKTKKEIDASKVNDGYYTIPKYTIKQQKNIEFEDFTYNKDCKQYATIPNQIVIDISLPLLSSTIDCTLDVEEKQLKLVSEKPAKYKLKVNFPYSVDENSGNAKFDKTKRKLIVTLPVLRKTNDYSNSVKFDSGVDSDDHSGSQSDEEHEKLVTEIEETQPNEVSVMNEEQPQKLEFFNPTLSYNLPSYTHNILDDMIAFTFHVKNTEPDSVKVQRDDNKIYVKFTSVGSGFVPVHYAAIIVFDNDVLFDNISGEAWDNNVILQLDLRSDTCHKYQIGLSECDLKEEYFDIHPKSLVEEPNTNKENLEQNKPLVEVVNLGNETNIVVSSNIGSNSNDIEDSPKDTDNNDITWTENSTETSAKSILRKPLPLARSLSESSIGEVASSMDYISSDCIPEESSLKKTVRFNDVIARQFYRYNSSIEGQKKKNQRKKSKKRSQDRRKSESEAEDENIVVKNSQMNKKADLKPRRDSGLADTSDAEGESKISDNDNVFVNNSQDSLESHNNVESQNSNDIHITSENLKHQTNFYDPEKLNKGQYTEVQFKNDLIFDLDM